MHPPLSPFPPPSSPTSEGPSLPLLVASLGPTEESSDPVPPSTKTLPLPDPPHATTALLPAHAITSMHAHLPTLRTCMAVALLEPLANVGKWACMLVIA